MKTAVAIGAFVGVLMVPCFAGDLEQGVKFQERKEYSKAIAAFKSAAANGNAEAQRRLGFMYYHGEGVAQDNERAIALFEKAADAGDVESASNLGKMYEYGIGVRQDDRRAAFWHTKGAELGDPLSQFNASVMYYKGDGVPKDRAEAMKWWTLAMTKDDAVAERIRRTVESAQVKLTPDEIGEGKRRAAEWIEARARK